MPSLRATSALALIALCGCGNKEAPPRAEPAPADATLAASIDAAPPPFPVEELGKDGVPAEAIAAWTAVVDRYQYLERRGDSGVVVGAFSGNGEFGPYLRDLDEGDGLLAIQVQFPGEVEIQENRRAVVWGRWVAVGASAWVWKASKLGWLPGKVEPPPHAPGLKSAEPRPIPDGTKGPDEVGDGELMVFIVRKRPAKVGDGWGISRANGKAVVAQLVLPGERGAYGGQDMRAKSERWRLGRGGRYQVKVRKVYRFDNKIDVLFAAGPPAGVLR
ncbi:MAG: hypothetical protein KJO07_23530 [Deltaproteobacteria bacterium]|nr:hypothetical protein [Deltaproteobacteria bacterium]